LLAQVYKRKRANQPDEDLLPDDAQSLSDLLTNKGADQGGYVQIDGNWWIPSGRVYFDPGVDIADPTATAVQELAAAQQSFFLPRKMADPFDNCTTVDYDDYDLLLVRTADALNNTVIATNDYRVLQPRLVTDPNRNRTEVCFDALGMVVATAVMGKVGENLGDLLDDFVADLLPTDPPLPTLQSFVADPHTHKKALLTRATMRIVYDLDRWMRAGQPTFAATLARETHFHDPGGAATKIQVSFSYSDGFGREIQKKIQAEAGDAPQRGQNVILPSGDVRTGELMRNAQGELVNAFTSPRWVGTGRTVFNNKGKPVRQYEPFFSSTHLYEEEREMTDTGVSPILFYDPAERVVATLHPNHTWEKVVFDHWQQATYDVNDTVLNAGGSTDPKLDPDVQGFFERLPDKEYLPTWYEQRIMLAANDPERMAANKTAVHRQTPTIAHFDALGRPFLTIAHNRLMRNGVIIEEQYATRVALDIEGNQREVRDAIVQAGDKLGRVVMRYDYDMLGNRIHQASMEAGERWMLNDVTGKPICAWDSRGFTRRMTYDELRRPTGLNVTENGAERLAERTIYGEGKGDVGNHRTRVYQVYDGAGVVTNVEYDFKGNLLASRRELLPDYKLAVDWLQNPPANDGSFASHTTYDALNRPVMQVTPHNPATRPNVIQPVYNEANLLDKLYVWLRRPVAPAQLLDPATADFQAVTNINYNERGQRNLVAYGNGATSTYAYDKETFRLRQLKTERAATFAPNQRTVQDLSYTYDPVGNITHIQDDADIHNVIFFRNERVEPSADYEYDSLYRLVKASGREHLGQTGGQRHPPRQPDHEDAFNLGLLHPGDGRAMGNYTEWYDYDAVGNILKMRHQTGSGSWTRGYSYSEPSLLEPGKPNNRLSRTSLPGDDLLQPATYRAAYAHDEHGNMTQMPHLTSLLWDYEDQLQATTRQVVVNGGVPETTYYVYDAVRQRVRKVTERQAQPGVPPRRLKERIYLGDFEIYREYSGNDAAISLERETLHVMDDQQRIALVETKTLDTSQPPVANPQALVRYQLGNHLGSTSLELNDQAQIISYEEYTPYGSTSYQAVRSQTETPKRYRYTGKERDEESGLYYHGARYYAPWLGLWVKFDPDYFLRYQRTVPTQSYVYANNNPVIWIDHEGKTPEKTDQGSPRPDRPSDLIDAAESSNYWSRIERFIDTFKSTIERLFSAPQPSTSTAGPTDTPMQIPSPVEAHPSTEHKYVLPVAGSVRIRPGWMDPRKNKDTGKKDRPHMALDFMAPAGRPVRAMIGGTISKVVTWPGGGRTLIINGADGKLYVYMHLQGYAKGIAKGVTVSTGSPLGFVGNSIGLDPKTGQVREGRPEGSHLHLEIHEASVWRKHNPRVDPFAFIKEIVDPQNKAGKVPFIEQMEFDKPVFGPSLGLPPQCVPLEKMQFEEFVP
jgi:RHS repeat-associated protein